jgi:hypothetical protein
MDFDLFASIAKGYRASCTPLQDRDLRNFFITCASLMTVDLQYCTDRAAKLDDEQWATDWAERAIDQVNLTLKDQIWVGGEQYRYESEMETLEFRCEEISYRRLVRMQAIDAQLAAKVKHVLKNKRSATYPDGYRGARVRVGEDTDLKETEASYVAHLREAAIEAVRGNDEWAEVSGWMKHLGEFLHPLEVRFWQWESH